MNKKIKKGFTLIEVLLAMAIVAISVGLVVGSLSGQKQKANTSKALGEISSVLQSIVMCKADGGAVSSPSNNAVICTINGSPNPGYGKWPSISSTVGAYNPGNLISQPTSADWYFSVRNGTATKICCNARTLSCFEKESCDQNMTP